MKNRVYEIAINRKYDESEKGLSSKVYNFFKKDAGSGPKANANKEIQKPLIKEFKRMKVYARFNDNIWLADLAEMGSLSSKIWGVNYLLCVIDVFTKFLWDNPLKDEKTNTVLDGFV